MKDWLKVCGYFFAFCFMVLMWMLAVRFMLGVDDLFQISRGLVEINERQVSDIEDRVKKLEER